MKEGRSRESTGVGAKDEYDQSKVYVHMNMSQWNLFFCAINMP